MRVTRQLIGGTLAVAAAAGYGYSIVSPAGATNPDSRTHPVGAHSSGQSPDVWASKHNTGSSWATTNVLNAKTSWGSGAVYQGYGTASPETTTWVASGASLGGVAICNNIDRATGCTSWTVNYYPSYWSSAETSSDSFWKGLACHEVVHTVGVGERTGATCLDANWINGHWNDQGNLGTVIYPSDSNISEINAIWKNTPA